MTLIHRQLPAAPAPAGDRMSSPDRHCARHLPVLVLAFILIAITVPVLAGPDGSVLVNGTGPQNVNITVYVVDFHRFDVSAGSVGVDFYLDLKSDEPISINDVELMNGMVTSVSPIIDTPNKKEYRIIAVLTAEPDLRQYPFDDHTLSIRIEPKLKNREQMAFVIDPVMSGLNQEANVPGWRFTGARSAVLNHSYFADEIPYSRAVFDFGVSRDVTSTLLKFFLPLMLIVIVSLSSLMMRATSRLGLNASMFLAAVLIHWRIADAIPVVAYATFLDLFMIITYATLVMVLISGVLIMRSSEVNDTDRIDRINYWAIRIIPSVCIGLYCVLFLTLLL